MVLMVVAASAIGALGTWFLLGGNQAATPAVAPAPSPSSAMLSEAPPNVAHLSPADGAVLLGNWHYDRQRWFQAIEQYEGALRLGKDNPDVRTDLGNCYRFIKQPQKALEQYEISQRMQPLHRKPITASEAERRRNPRSRSAKLRCGIHESSRHETAPNAR